MALKTVISASRRTDIPAFYLKWFIQHLKQGFIRVENPFNAKQVRNIDLRPDSVEWIVFWSRNFHTFLKHRHAFLDYNLFFHFTILERSLFDLASPPVYESVAQMKKLAKLYTPDVIVWRYDPLIFWQQENVVCSNHNPDTFAGLCREISSAGIRQCYISLVHPYQKFLTRLKTKYPGISHVAPSEMELENTISKMVEIACDFSIQLSACCTENLETYQGIGHGKCINGSYLNVLMGTKKVSEAKAGTRPGCGCTRSTDIGNYARHPCHSGCLYCYANPFIP
jgi:hypothetical protein